jgi:hypothetical protein
MNIFQTLVVVALVSNAYLLYWMGQWMFRFADRNRELINVSYPAFPPKQIEQAHERLQRAKEESLKTQEKWMTSGRWKRITKQGETPTDADKRSMREVAHSIVAWNHELMRLHFLIEGNLSVTRGEWSIAQARYFYEEIVSFSFKRMGEAEEIFPGLEFARDLGRNITTAQ